MKKRFIIILSIFIVTFILSMSTVYAWLFDGIFASFPEDFTGSTEIAYFESGDGSREHPYVISNRVHFYNLAWLQYLGYFNMNKDLNNGRSQSYFEIKNNIDMMNLEIPPIGTSEYPFLGYINGNDKIVENITISNLKGDFRRYPARARFNNNDLLISPLLDSTNDEVCNIVGVFGVIGEYEDSLSHAFGTEGTKQTEGNLTYTPYTNNDTNVVTKVYEPCDVNDYPTDSSTLFLKGKMQVEKMYLDKVTVKSHSLNTLLGLVCGYASSTINDIGIYKTSLTYDKNATGLTADYGNVLSKYSIIGDYNEDTITWDENPITGGQGTDLGFGGSIDFKTLSKRLSYIIGSSKTNVSSSGSNYYRVMDGTITNNSYSGIFNGYVYCGEAFNYQSMPSSTTYAYCDLKDYTTLPINVDLNAQGLTDGYQEITSSKIGLNFVTNDIYDNSIKETVSRNNTGYIVGGQTNSTYSNGHVRIRMQKLATTSSIYNTFGVASSDMNSNYKYDDEKVQIITNTDSTWNVIKDDYNKIMTSPHNVYSSYGFKTPSELGLKKYNAIRPYFGNFIGKNGIIYGLRFSNTSSTAALTSNTYSLNTNLVSNYKNVYINGVTYDNYQMIKSYINFTTPENGIVTMLLGSYVYSSATSKYCAPCIYKLERDSNGNINKCYLVERVYENNGEYGLQLLSNEGTTGTTSGNLVYDARWYTNIMYNSLAYAEIPLPAGDYALGLPIQMYMYTTGTPCTPAYLLYLDIGANTNAGEGGTSTLAYTIDSVDYVANLTNRYNYKDVVFKLEKVETTDDVTIYYKRDSGGEENETIASIVKYLVDQGSVMVTPSPADLGTNGTEGQTDNWE